jgi:hypothetical protein
MRVNYVLIMIEQIQNQFKHKNRLENKSMYNIYDYDYNCLFLAHSNGWIDSELTDGNIKL